MTRRRNVQAYARLLALFHLQPLPTGRRDQSMLDEVAALFRDLRRVLGKSAVEVAAELGAPTQAIVALEHGHLALLPPWPETARIVRDYTAMAGIDPRPALIVLQAAFAEYESKNQTPVRREEGRIAYAEWVPTGNVDPGWPLAGQSRQPEAPARLAPYGGTAPATVTHAHAPQPHQEFRPVERSAPDPQPTQSKPIRSARVRDAAAALPGTETSASSPSWRKGRSGIPVPAPATVSADSSIVPAVQPDASGPQEETSAWAHFTANLSRARPRLAVPPARIAIIAGLVCGIPLVAAAALSQSAFVAAATTHLPGPVASIIRSSHDFLIHRFASTYEGMRWIDVDEPRARRTDKLPAREQSD